MLQRFAIRDVLLLLGFAALWWKAAPLTEGSGPAADLLGVLAGLALGAGAYVIHEWGHLLGALATRSALEMPERLASVSLFSFDSKRNGRRQFLAMSFSGFAMTGVALLVVYGLLPEGQLATRVARGAVLALTSLTVLVEFPLVLWALVRSDLPPVETLASHRRARRGAA